MSLPIALELYSVRDLYRENFEACLEKVAAIGYTGVECFGGLIDPAQKVIDALAKTGLELVSWHIPLNLVEGDAADATIAYFKQVGCTRCVVPGGAPEDTWTSREGVLAFAKRMEAIKTRFAKDGISVGYHNHHLEFIPLPDGEYPWAVLMDNTTIIGQFDNGNALSSETPGLDVVDVVSRWPGRAQTVHLKPYSYTTHHATMIGEDDIDWPAFLDAAERIGGAQWFIVEYEDETHYTQFEGVEACLKALKKLLK